MSWLTALLIAIVILVAAGIVIYTWTRWSRSEYGSAPPFVPLAVDTTEKKLSLLNFNTCFLLVLPEADGVISQGDMQHFLNLYSGILALGPVGKVGGGLSGLSGLSGLCALTGGTP